MNRAIIAPGKCLRSCWRNGGRSSNHGMYLGRHMKTESVQVELLRTAKLLEKRIALVALFLQCYSKVFRLRVNCNRKGHLCDSAEVSWLAQSDQEASSVLARLGE
jgi:hypothetical protein